MTSLYSQTLGLEYRSYLEQVVNVLEDDPQFKVILDNATEQEIKVSVYMFHTIKRCFKHS